MMVGRWNLLLGWSIFRGLCSFQKVYQQGDRTQVFRPACLSHWKTVELCVEIPSLEASFLKIDPKPAIFVRHFWHDQTGSPPSVVAGCPSAWWYLCSERCRGWETGAVLSVESQRWQVFGRYVLWDLGEVSKNYGKMMEFHGVAM